MRVTIEGEEKQILYSIDHEDADSPMMAVVLAARRVVSSRMADGKRKSKALAALDKALANVVRGY